MNDASTLSVHRLDVRDLRAAACASYGEIVASLRAGGQGAETHHNPETPPTGAKRVPGNGEPRVCIMHLRHVGLRFSRIARRRRGTQGLGSRGGRERPIGVALPSDLSDDARPRSEDIAAFRIPGDRVVKWHVATWHARTHFVHDKWQFVNLENLHTNGRESHAVPFPAECRYRLSADSRRATSPAFSTDFQRKGARMPIPINDGAFDYLLARAGLALTEAEKDELKTVCDGIAAMAERVRKPRGRMAEPALTYGFADEDLQ